VRVGALEGERDPEVVDRFVMLRRVFALGDPPAHALFRAVANSRLIAWVNGVEVARGPVRTDPRRVSAEVADVTRALRPGRNVVAVLARYYGVGTSWWLPGPVTLGLGGGAVAAELRLGEDRVIGTDERWSALPGTAWRTGRLPHAHAGFLFEALDARELPAGWTLPEFDDSDWPSAESLKPRNFGSRGPLRPPSDPFGPLPARPIPQLRGELRYAVAARVASASPAAPQPDPLKQVLADQHGAGGRPPWRDADPRSVSVVDAGFHLVSLDFGETVAGTVRLDVEAPAGTRLDVAFGERERDGLLVDAFAHHALRYLARGDNDRHEGFDPVGGRHAVVSVRASGPVTLRVSVQERLFPRRADSARFRCSDPVLERIFEVGLRTVDLCSLDAYIDCPTRELRAWTGDSVVHQAVHLATCDDWSLARWHPRMAAAPRTDGMLPMAAVSNFGGHPLEAAYIPDWSLHWIRSVHNLMRYTGDRELVAGLLPQAEGVLRWFLPYLQGGGLLSDVPGWVLIDWSDVPVAGTSAALNALWARGLRDFEDMARWLGDDGRGSWARRLRGELGRGFDAFWDSARGLYRDHRVAGSVQPSVSRHTTAAAVCAGIVPRQRLAAVAARLAERAVLAHSSVSTEAFDAGEFERGLSFVIDGRPEPSWDVHTQVLEAQPFFRYVVHDALAEAGRPELVADACRDWSRLLSDGVRTWPESWAGGSRCHGWSSTPTRDLIVHTLGIAPAEPGFTRARVAPALGDLEWAEATVPTPHGPLRVRADRSCVEVDSPVPFEGRSFES
jgi:hypothetical protein